MVFLGLIPVIVISILWYLPGIWAQGKSRAFSAKDYIKAALIYGVLYSCLLIVATEVIWDIAMDVVGFLTASENSRMMQVTGYVLLAAAIVLAVIYTVKTMIKVCRIAKKESADYIS